MCVDCYQVRLVLLFNDPPYIMLETASSCARACVHACLCTRSCVFRVCAPSLLSSALLFLAPWLSLLSSCALSVCALSALLSLCLCVSALSSLTLTLFALVSHSHSHSLCSLSPFLSLSLLLSPLCLSLVTVRPLRARPCRQEASACLFATALLALCASVCKCVHVCGPASPKHSTPTDRTLEGFAELGFAFKNAVVLIKTNKDFKRGTEPGRHPSRPVPAPSRKKCAHVLNVRVLYNSLYCSLC